MRGGEGIKGEVIDFLPVVRELALKAGARIMELLHTPLVHARKEDKSLVTNADHAANDILRRGLRKAFPKHSLISEETSLEGPGSEYVWLVDPLDGTKAYARGIAGFSVMVGLLKEERPVLGVVYDPLEGHFYEAAEGGGCFYVFKNRRTRARVSDRAEWPQMPLITSTGFPGELRSRLEKILGVPFLEPINSVGVKVGYLVRQAADLYINHHPVHYWDTCAPAVILKEAGGRMTFWDGSPLRFDLSGNFSHSGPTVATNGRRHAELLSVLAGVRRP